MSEQRKYRTFTAQQKIEIVLAGLRGDRSIKELCREHEIAETLYYNWREKLLEGGKAALVGADDQAFAGGAGTAYVFSDANGNWLQEAKLVAANGSPGDTFGYSVSLSGSVAVVGAFDRDSSRGAA